MAIYIYDSEVYQNLTLLTFKDISTGQIRKFKQTKNKTNFNKFQEFVENPENIFVGYNNSHYDNRIIQFIQSQDYKFSTYDVYNLSLAIIENKIESGFKAQWNNFNNTVKSYNKNFKSIDLYVYHKNKSLKFLALGLSANKIQELPYSPYKELEEAEIEQIETYCENDVNITELLYKDSLSKIEARKTLNEQYKEIKEKLHYKQDFLNLSDSKLAADVLALDYCNTNNIDFWSFQKLRKPDYNYIQVKDLLPENIKFNSTECQKLLSKLESQIIELKAENIVDYKNKDNFETLKPSTDIKEEVIINGKKYQIGLGGLHSTIKNKIYEGEIIDIDVSSYYPNLIINEQIKPDFLDDSWIENYKILTEKRLNAKNNNDEQTAAALKIVINSAYGNYLYPYFYAYNPKTAYTVTLRGQLYLLKLIETLENSGHEVISANTDGITYIKNSKQNDDIILKNWEAETGLKLEKTKYKKFIEKDVNNYSALKDNNEIKRKGMFSLPTAGKGLSANIITIAVEKYIFENIPISETINGCFDIRLFLYSKQAGKKFKVEYGSENLQQVNRYFISDSKKAQYLKKRDEQDNISNIVANNRVIIANDLSNKELIQLVNKNHYITEASKILNDLYASKRAAELNQNILKAVQDLKNQGITAIPKEYKKNTKGINLKNLPETFDFSSYPTIAAQTGNGIIAIDIDYPELLPNKLRELLLNCNTLKSYVDKGKRIKVFFKNVPSEIKQRSYLKSYGFEILNGKPANIYGAYNFEKVYQYEGVVADIPIEILEILKRIQSIEKPVSNTKEDYNAIDSEKINTALDYIRYALNDKGIIFKESAPGEDYQKSICHELAQVIFHFPCPFSDEHTSSGNDDVILCLGENGKIFIRCWHESCRESILNLRKELNKELNIYLEKLSEKTDSNTINPKSNKEQEFIKELEPINSIDIEVEDFYNTLKDSENKSITLINAPTGCGKTFTSIKYAIDSTNIGEKIAIVCSTIEEVKRTVRIIKGYKYNDFSIATSGFDTEPKKFKSIVITTYAYLASKGDSGKPYAIAKGILSDRIVICDEIQMIETYSNKIIPLCGRYQEEGNTLKLTTQCLRTSRKGTCENCNMIIESKIDLKTLEFSLYPTLPYVEKYKTQIKNKNTNKIFQPDFYNDISINCLKTQKIKPTDKLFNLFPFIQEHINNFEDLELRIQFPYIQDSDKKEFLTQQNIIESGENIKTQKIKYPKYACAIPALHCKSKMFFENLFSYSKKVIAMSATIPENVKKDFIVFSKRANFKFKQVDITTVAIKFNVNVIKLERKLSHSDIKHILKSINKSTFLVEPTLYDAKLQYDELTKDPELAGKIIFFKQGDYTNIYENIQSESKVENNLKTVRLTYANSAICRAKDMPDIDFVIVDCSQFLPTLALEYDSNKIDRLEMREIQAQNISDKLHQIIGRVFRSNLKYNPAITQIDERKIILLLHHLPYELQNFKPNLKILNSYNEYCNEFVTGLLDKERKDSIINTIKEIANNKTATNKALEQKYKIIKKAIKLGVSKLNRRTEYDLLDDEDKSFIKSKKRDKNSYKEILSYFVNRYDYKINTEVYNG